MNSQVSVFKNIRNLKNPKTYEIDKVLNAIKDEKIKPLIDKIRAEKNKSVRQKLKMQLPCILFSGTFEERLDNAMIEHSGFICLDFDDFENEEQLKEFRKRLIDDKYIYCLFISPSGLGLKALIRVPKNKEDHRNHFRALEEYYDTEHFDSSSINESRVCYMSSDNELYVKKDAHIFKSKIKLEAKKHQEVKVEVEDDDKKIQGLYSWWSKKFGIVDGERNRNTFILAMAFNEFGISELKARNFMSQFEHEGFDMSEIKTCIKSAYSKTHLFGTKKFESFENYYDSIKPDNQEKTKVNFHNIYESAFIDVTQKIEHPPTAISIGRHKVSGKEYPTDFATYGNFSCITGASKSRKTFFKSLITSRYLGDTSKTYSDLIRGHENEELFVLDIDTEQSKFHAQKVFKRVMSMLNIKNHSFYKPFALRPYSPKERVEFIEWLIYESDFKNNIGLVCIDGLADLVDDFNDLKETNKMINKVMKWTDNKQFHLTTILHSNFGSTKAVGHIGSSALKKAETICSVSTENDITTVRFTHTRGFPIDDFQFRIDDDALPVQLDLYDKPKKIISEKDFNKEISEFSPKKLDKSFF